MPVLRAVTEYGASLSVTSGASSRSRTRTVARELSTLTPTQASSGMRSMTSFFILSADQVGQNEPLSTPHSARARSISPLETSSLPSTSMSQTKSREAASSAKQTASPAMSATRWRSRRLTAGAPRSLSVFIEHWQRRASVRAVSRSRGRRASRSVKSSSGSAPQKRIPASASAFKNRGGSAPSTCTHTLLRRYIRRALIRTPPRVCAL